MALCKADGEQAARRPGVRSQRRLGFAAGMWLICIFAASDGAASAPEPRAWLGAGFETAESGQITLVHVVRNSPAARAGLKQGDRITAVDGNPVSRPAQLVEHVTRAGPHGSVVLLVKSADREKSVTVPLLPRPDDEAILRLDHVGTTAILPPVVPVAGAKVPGPEDLQGKVVVLDFWATWCGACKLLSPHLSRLQKTYGPQGLAVIALTTEEENVVARAVEKQRMAYTVARDPDKAATASFGVRSLPTLFVIDRSGIIREVFVGFAPGKPAALEAVIQRLLLE